MLGTRPEESPGSGSNAILVHTAPMVGSGVTYILGGDKIEGAPRLLLAGDEMQ